MKKKHILKYISLFLCIGTLSYTIFSIFYNPSYVFYDTNLDKIIKNLQSFYKLPNYEKSLQKSQLIEKFYNQSSFKEPFLKYVYASLKCNNKTDNEINNYINNLINKMYKSNDYVNELFNLIADWNDIVNVLFNQKNDNATYLKTIFEDVLNNFFSVYYNPKETRPGNWWYWEIGIPKKIAIVLSFIPEIYSFNEYKLWTNTIIEFTNNYLKQNGGNLLDISIPRFIAFSLNKSINASKLIKYVFKNSLSLSFNFEHKNGTFYYDGSFLEHGSVPYFGGYGVVWLEGINEYKFILENTDYDLRKQNDFENFFKIIEVAIMPYMYDLAFSASLTGRGISREGYNEREKGNVILTKLLNFINIAPDKYKNRLINFILSNIDSDEAKKYISNELKEFEKNNKFQVINKREIPNNWNELHRFTNEPNIMFGVDNFNHNNKMWFAKNQDRYVVQKNNFSITIPLVSQRTMQSENMNNENFFWYYYANGNTMINKRNVKSYSWDYFLGIDPFKMPGTSSIYEFNNENMTLDQINANATKSRYLWKNVNKGYSNGITLDKYGFITSNISNYDEKLWTNKNYVIIDDAIFILGKVNKTKELDKDILTTVSNDNVKENISKESIVLNNKNIDKYTSNNIEYYILENLDAIKHQNIQRSVNNQTNNLSISPGISKFNFSEIYYNHSTNNNPLFCYIISPDKNTNVSKIISNLKYEINDNYSIIQYKNDLNKEYFFIQSKIKNQEIKINNSLKIQLNEETSCILEKSGNNYKMIISPNFNTKKYKFKLIGNIKVTNKNKNNEITNDKSSFLVDTRKITTDVLHNSWLEFIIN